MTYLPTLHNRLWNEALNEFFTPTFTRKMSIDHEVLANKENYSIWELPNGHYEVRVELDYEKGKYYRSTTRTTLGEAKEYIDEQIKYHERKSIGPVQVWSGKDGDIS